MTVQLLQNNNGPFIVKTINHTYIIGGNKTFIYQISNEWSLIKPVINAEDKNQNTYSFFLEVDPK